VANDLFLPRSATSNVSVGYPGTCQQEGNDIVTILAEAG